MPQNCMISNETTSYIVMYSTLVLSFVLCLSVSEILYKFVSVQSVQHVDIMDTD